ncbi:MAG: aminopeptidase P family protein [Candidatus Dormibacteraeota bacterium]|uniref:Aminopeptidase P family protein n=1 Tax=Candidatus Dormiibacter inghamiae TaxID=3127013 RepID=A0A934N6Q5_9BACT|nr:aminopeptidase P family protein [Candidatus Dormibacteraeota bacterium]MBJ7605222.1 aminopeptidase P family protein [Candidatus Dormibacteraeota bacterium]
MTDRGSQLRVEESTVELERRWTNIRNLMLAAEIDVLVAQTTTPDAGYVRYLSGQSTRGGHGLSVIFPIDGEMTIVTHGAYQGDVRVNPSDRSGLAGVRRLLTDPYFPAVPYCKDAENALITRALTEYGDSTIGLVGAHQTPYSLRTQIDLDLPAATLVDATDLVDEVRVVKSQEEIVSIRRTAELQDAAMRFAFDVIRPGIRGVDVTAEIERFCRVRGSESGLYLIGSAPPGDPTGVLRPIHQQYRTIQRGDVISILIECSGPGGLYCELGRTAILGGSSRQLVDELEILCAAQSLTADHLRPGADCTEIWLAHNAFLSNIGRPVEKRVHAHGQGYDIVEPPLIRPDEPGRIRAGMNIACHPSYVQSGLFCWVCDNYLVTEQGAERIHAMPQEVGEL